MIIEKINSILWGVGTILLIFGTGIFFSVKIGFKQLNIVNILKKTLLLKSEKSENTGTLTRFQALSTALAASMGTGNIIGVAAAITIGGAGSIFWMWVSAIFSMAIAYAENYLGVLYKKRTGSKTAGAMLYLENGLKSKPLSVLFAVSAIFVSLSMGNTVQSNAIALSADTFGIPHFITGLIISAGAGLILFGGAACIAKASERIIPFVSGVYIIGCLIAIFMNLNGLPAVFAGICKGAFGIDAVTGAVSGLMIRQAVTTGLRRGIFSNEAGMGSSVFVHTETDCKDPDTMGSWAILEVFIDTILCCSLTAFVILLTVGGNSDGVNIVFAAFGSVFGSFAEKFVAVCTILFAFATLIGWSYYGEKSLKYVIKRNSAPTVFRIIYIILIAVGAVINTSFLWGISDIFNALMLLINIFGILFLSREVKKH
ncbi:MAG: alanine:cation symporter family protein [Ruminococcus sp.]|jgi:AGCS family alanine or glycine:cation symporter|nr:alanine:cation symporter family protein [Ruminococcus sp.]